MAPEYPPKLIVWDLHLKADRLEGSLSYVELADSAERLRVRWGVTDEPPGFFPVGDGVAFVHQTASVVLMPISREARPEFLGGARYRIQEGLPPHDPWLMEIVILPEGYTLDHPNPAPASVKAFQQRLALYWVLEGDRQGRTQVEWTLKPLEVSLDDEVERLHRTGSPTSFPTSANIDLDRISITGSTVNIFSAGATQHNQSGGINVESQGNIEIGGSVVGRDQTGGSPQD